MKPEQIEVGAKYKCRVGDGVVDVTVDATHEKRGWLVTPLEGGEQQQVLLANQFRERITDQPAPKPDGRFAAKTAPDEDAATEHEAKKGKKQKGQKYDHSDLTPAEAEEREQAKEEIMRETQKYDPDKCHEPRCRGAVVGTYLGKPYCDNHNPLAESDEEKMSSKTPVKSRKRAKSAAKATTPKGKAPKSAKAPKNPAAKKERKPREDGKLSMMDAVIQVLKAAKNKPMNCKELIAAMAEKGLWSSPNGKTPHATLYARFLTEINEKGKESRFVKADRGLFALAE